MKTIEKIDQLAAELVKAGLTASLSERKRSELVLLLMQECKFKFDDEDKESSDFDNCYFAEAFSAALSTYDKKITETPFLAYFKACYRIKSQGLQFDKMAKAKPDVYTERLASMKELIEKIGKSEGIDYQAYKNGLRYLNKEKILAKLSSWGVEEKYREAVEAILTSNNINYIDAQRENEDGSEPKDPYSLLPAVKKDDSRLQLLLADIIEKSYAISKVQKLYALNHCEWSGQLYENYDTIIPVIFEIYLEKGYISYYEAQTLWEILANELLGAYLHYAPETIRKKRKQLQTINLQAWKEVGEQRD